MEERKSIEAVYERLRKGTKLPSYAQANAEYDLDSISHDATRPAREVAKKLFERTDAFRKILEAVLQPEGLSEMQETDALGGALNDEIVLVLRELMRIDRMLLAVELDNTEGAYVAFFVDAHARWMSVKTRLVPIMTALERCWSQPNGAKGKLHYLG